MKQLFNVIILALALNFLALAGTVGYLAWGGRIDREKITAIREILFPPPEEPVTETPETEATTRPSQQLEQLLAKYTGFTSAEKIEQVQHTFDAQMAQMERKRQELARMQEQIELARNQLARDREALTKAEADLRIRQEEARRLESDQGFQDSLALYRSMPTRQVKQVFMGLDDQTVLRYLQAMPERVGARIIKEFKTPEEISRIQRILEQMRQAESAQPASDLPAQTNASMEGP